MSVSLNKNDVVSLSKDVVVNDISIGLGWSSSKYSEDEYDLDASCYILQKNGLTRYEDDFVFYGNKKSHNGSIVHSGDNTTGSSGNVDDEVIIVKFNELPTYAERIVIVVSIYEAERRMQNFGIIDSAHIRVVDNFRGEEILRYNLKEKFGNASAIKVAELYRDKSEWKFHAIGEGYEGGLAKLCEEYGIEVS